MEPVFLLAAEPINLSLSNQEAGLIFLIGGLTLLVNLASGLANVWDKFRTRPPLSEALETVRKEFLGLFAQKGELTALQNEVHALRTERKEDIDALRVKIDSVEQSVHQGFHDVLRSLGRVEGKVEKNA